MLTALNAAALEHVQLNAGVILVGFDPSQYNTVEALRSAVAACIGDDSKCLGATRGGGNFRVTRETHEIEADGKRYSFVGSTLVDNVDAYISTTLIEHTSGNIKRALGAADVVSSSKLTTITPRTEYKPEDYIPSMCWVGDTADGFMCIWLKNAINQADYNMTYTDKGEGELEVEFHAAQDDVGEYTEPPFKIYKVVK